MRLLSLSRAPKGIVAPDESGGTGTAVSLFAWRTSQRFRNAGLRFSTNARIPSF
jgi:hypothetical protein